MLFGILKIPAKLALRIYCRSIKINRKDLLDSEGPLLIAANHPNSFLDAIIIASLFKRPVYSLARGDAFVSNSTNFLLRSLKMLPVYRISEGAENLGHNYKTFDSCKEIFKQNGIVLIFSEGLCVYEWHLRPLKKGTARLILDSWLEGIPVKVLPLGINYSSFKSFGKNVELNFGKTISPPKESTDLNRFGKNIIEFNTNLRSELEKLVVEIDSSDKKTIRETFSVPVSKLKKILLTIPAAAGFLLHAPLYYPIKKTVTGNKLLKDHYDSVIVGSLLLLYPFYTAIICGITYLIMENLWCLSAIAILPFTAWSYVQLKKQFEE